MYILRRMSLPSTKVSQTTLVYTSSREEEYYNEDLSKYKSNNDVIVDRFSFKLQRYTGVDTYHIIVTSYPKTEEFVVTEFYMKQNVPWNYSLNMVNENYVVAGPIVNYMTEKSEIVLITTLGKKISIKSIYSDKKGLFDNENNRN